MTHSKVALLIEPYWLLFFFSIGFFILAAYFCLFVLDRAKRVGLILIFIIVFAWGSVSHANNQFWADQKTYALYWSQQVPGLNSPYFYLADAYQRQGDFKEAKKYYRMSLSGDLSDLYILNNLGMLDDSSGNLKEAESDYKMILKVDPHSSNANHNLGALYLEQE